MLARLMRRRHAEEYMPTGLYLVGEVGRGKSMLMDLFFDTADGASASSASISIASSRTSMRASMPGRRRIRMSPTRSRRWRTRSRRMRRLLCFDEFQVNDIADAMILGRLFQALFDRGVVVVTTSNIAPDDLFKGQPGRDAFLPFIALIKQRLELLVMNGGRDYRRERMRGLRTWQVPADEMSRHELDKAFLRLTGGSAVRPVTPDSDGPRTRGASGL